MCEGEEAIEERKETEVSASHALEMIKKCKIIKTYHQLLSL